MPGQRAVGIRAIEVISVDRSEGLVDCVRGQQDGLRGAPRLGAAGGDCEARRNVFERLKNIVNGNAFLKARPDNFSELLLDILANNENELAESRTESVEDGVVDDGFACGSDGVNLLQTAVAAAHSGSKN